MPIDIEPIESNVLRDSVERAILQSLSNGELKPGDQVKETEIARQAGISRGPVREAIQHLVGEEILVSYPHRGTFVSEWTNKEILEVYSVRALLEGYAACLAVENATQEELEELASLVDEMVLKAEEGDEESVLELDLKFHLRAYELSKHKLLCRMLEKLRRRIYFYVKMDAETTPSLIHYAKNHTLLIEALKSGNSDKAERVFREHIKEVGDSLAERFRQKNIKKDGNNQ